MLHVCLSVCLSSCQKKDSELQVTSSDVDLYNADKYRICSPPIVVPVVKFKRMCHKPLLSRTENPKYPKSAVVGTAASSNVSVRWKVKPYTLITELELRLAPDRCGLKHDWHQYPADLSCFSSIPAKNTVVSSTGFS